MANDPFMEENPPHEPLHADPTLLINRLSEMVLSTKHHNLLQALLPEPGEIDIQKELIHQYTLLKSLQTDILNQSQKAFIIEATPQQVSSMLGQVNSFLSLYVRAQKDFDLQGELHILRNAITQAVKDLPEEEQEIFFNELTRLTQV